MAASDPGCRRMPDSRARGRLYDWSLLLVSNLIGPASSSWSSGSGADGTAVRRDVSMAIATVLLIPIVRRERPARVPAADIWRSS